MTGIPSVCMLPPCAVCGGRSSGFHYGANTCEACKSFFRRTIHRRKGLYKCNYRNNCNQIQESSKICKACRFQKCIIIGMSIEASKNGRYTLEKRNSNISEVKRLELQGKMDCNGTKTEQSKREIEIEKLVKNFSDLSTDSGFHRKTIEEVLKIEEDFSDQREFDSTIFGPSEIKPRDVYRKILKTTGIDLQGLCQKIPQILMAAKPRSIFFFNFSQYIPGFKNIPLIDQNKIFTDFSIERWFLIYSCWTNVDDKLFYNPFQDKVLFTHDDLLSLSNLQEEECEHFWNIIERFQRLEFNLDEMCIISALSIVNTKIELGSYTRDILSAGTDYLLEALSILVEKNHETEDHVIAKLILLITEVQTMEPFFEIAVENFMEDMRCLNLNFSKDYL